MKKKTVWITVAATAGVLAIGGASVAVAGDGVFDDDQHLQGEELRQASDAALAEVGPGTVTKAETSDDSNSAYEVDVRLDNGTAYDINLNESFEVIQVETEDDDGGRAGQRDDRDDNPTQPLTEAERTGASEAALVEVGAGTVTKVERDDDGDSTFEVEVTLDDGGEVDVELGPDFRILEVDAPDYDN